MYSTLTDDIPNLSGIQTTKEQSHGAVYEGGGLNRGSNKGGPWVLEPRELIIVFVRVVSFFIVKFVVITVSGFLLPFKSPSFDNEELDVWTTRLLMKVELA